MSLTAGARLDSAKRTVWKDLTPADSAGIYDVAAHLVQDCKADTFSFNRTLSDLDVVDGFK